MADEEPRVAATLPVTVDLAAGTYYWCRCGRSRHQPFCDGSHRDSDFEPLRWDLEEGARVTLCCCKRTAGPPRCDGSHLTLDR